MMKGRKKKLVVWLLALSLLVSSVPGLSVAAVGSETTSAEISADEGDGSGTAGTGQDVSDEKSDAAVIDESDGESADGVQQPVIYVPEDSDVTKEPDGAAKPDEAVKQEESKEQEDSKKSEKDKEDEEKEDEEAQESLINYLIVGQAEMQAPGEQSVIVSYGDGTEEISSVKLVLAGEDDKQTEIPLTEKEEASYRFVKAFEKSEAGTYRLMRFAYEQDGHKKHIELEKIGISAQFTVQAGDAVQSEDECTEETGISVMTLTSDDISDDMTSQIESVIQEAADQAVEDVIEGAVELGASSTEQSYSRSGVNATVTAAVDDAVKLGSYSAPKAYTGTASSVVIVLDPGHGGTDNGAEANDLVEKTINLKIAQYCKAELEKHTGIRVYMTRTNDTYVGLEQRVAYAKSKGATLFVSIHMNSATSDKAAGAEVYYPNPNYNPTAYREGKAAAENILSELVELGLTSRGVKFLNATGNDDGQGIYADGSTADYYSVIRNSKKNGFPGIIVEHAFLTNENDAKQLKSEAFLKQLGEADAQGILKYCQTKTDYSPVYDFSYYVNRYSDIKRAYGNDPVGALNHFINYGMAERRQASKEFSVDAYMNRYSDVRTAFGTNYPAYYMHYINFGRKEGRVATTDGSKVNTDNATDNVKDNTAYNTVYAGVDYKDVYDYEYYINRYSDIAAIYSGDYAGALRHFVQYGMNEGRQAIGTFNVNIYKATYTRNGDSTKNDLRALGDNLKLYYMHYIEYGKAEGRIATSESDSEGANRNPDFELGSKFTTTYGMIDYAPVYDYDYYVAKYSDVRKAYGGNPDKVLQHFIRHGMDEGRIGKYTEVKIQYNDDDKTTKTTYEFNVHAYKNKYGDLRAAYGDNLKQYYLHYIKYGRAEGRTSELTPVTTYQDTDYSLIYDYDYYINKYSDIAAAFSNDPSGALQHFVRYGISEGRQACENFSVNAYKNNYADLRQNFGDNNGAYVRHYMTYGYKEGRNAKSQVLHNILGTSSTTVHQMVMYFMANASYPTYYTRNTDVKSIEDFCQLYMDECQRLGIRTEVAFCQAMKETNFLRFTGDVNISQYNFAGLGATGNNESGATFRSIKEGIRAQVQHLAAYANPNITKGIIESAQEVVKNNNGTSSTVNIQCVDPRFALVTKGSAPYVEWLGTKENPMGSGWATAEGYGYSIINDYMNKLETYSRQPLN